jgi:hypothetical protein
MEAYTKKFPTGMFVNIYKSNKILVQNVTCTVCILRTDNCTPLQHVAMVTNDSQTMDSRLLQSFTLFQMAALGQVHSEGHSTL